MVDVRNDFSAADPLALPVQPNLIKCSMARRMRTGRHDDPGHRRHELAALDV